MLCSLKHTGSLYRLLLPPTIKNSPESLGAIFPCPRVAHWGTWPGWWGISKKSPRVLTLTRAHQLVKLQLVCQLMSTLLTSEETSVHLLTHLLMHWALTQWGAYMQFLGAVQSHKFYLQARSEERNPGQSLCHDGGNVYHPLLLKSSGMSPRSDLGNDYFIPSFEVNNSQLQPRKKE